MSLICAEHGAPYVNGLCTAHGASCPGFVRVGLNQAYFDLLKRSPQARVPAEVSSHLKMLAEAGALEIPL